MKARPSEVSWALKEQIANYGHKTAVVTTARPMTENQLDRLRQTLGEGVSLKVETDPDILGGMIVVIGSKMIDDSLRTRLDRMEVAMKEAL